jgi:hypothetical protein
MRYHWGFCLLIIKVFLHFVFKFVKNDTFGTPIELKELNLSL